MSIFQQTNPNRRRYGLAVFIGIIAGIISAFVKWGAEHPFHLVALSICLPLLARNLC